MNVYRKLGLEPIINACGTVTRLGGAPMPQPVLDAYRQAAREWVSLEDLQAAASRKIAELTGTDAGLVTAGSAAALTLGTAAILTGHDLGRMERLPHCDGFADEFIIAREQRSGYDHAVRAAGARLVEIGFNEIVAGAGVRRTEAWEYEAAITQNTAGIVYVQAPGAQPALEDVVALAHKHKLPILVDAAGEVPPRSNLTAMADTGADLIAFSGGKGIRGPQSTGILCGRRDLVSSAALQMLDMDVHFELWEPPVDFIDRSQLTGIPRHGIGRGLKVSKEEIVALLTALDLFAADGYAQELAGCRECLESIDRELTDTRSACQIVNPSHDDGWPLLEIIVDEAALGKTAIEICRNLRQASPPVYVGHGRLHEGCLIINPICLDEQTSQALAKRLRDELT
jgi:L-seryl-tRNA(Ser) seleniumtransferase